MTRQRFLTQQQCVESVSVVETLDVTRNLNFSLDCACSVDPYRLLSMHFFIIEGRELKLSVLKSWSKTKLEFFSHFFPQNVPLDCAYLTLKFSLHI